MSDGPTFEQYLNSKKIDADRFKNAEPELWNNWKREFEQMHPNSFTVQKLNLINVIRRKYLAPTVTEEKTASSPATKSTPKPGAQPVRPGKPVVRPRVMGGGGNTDGGDKGNSGDKTGE